jgi:hypothetical protein
VFTMCGELPLSLAAAPAMCTCGESTWLRLGAAPEDCGGEEEERSRLSRRVTPPKGSERAPKRGNNRKFMFGKWPCRLWANSEETEIFRVICQTRKYVVLRLLTPP